MFHIEILDHFSYFINFSFQVGLKPAGGIRTSQDAIDWLVLVKEILGNDWLNSKLFRFGASGLLGDIERNLFKLVTGKHPADYECTIWWTRMHILKLKFSYFIYLFLLHIFITAIYRVLFLLKQNKIERLTLYYYFLMNYFIYAVVENNNRLRGVSMHFRRNVKSMLMYLHSQQQCAYVH